MPVMTETAGATPKIQTGRKREPFEKRFKAMFTELAKWTPTLQELSLYLNPTRGNFFTSSPNTGSKIDHKTVIDSHARRRIRDFGSGMISGCTSPGRPWFKYGLPDKDLEKYKPVREYLDECAQRGHEILADSNCYESLHMGYEEIATFGTSALMMLEDYRDVVRFTSYTAGEYALAIGPDGRVCAFARQYHATVDTLVKEFGLEACSATVKSAYQTNKTEDWIKVNLLIEINDTRVVGFKDFNNMQYRCVYWEEGSPSDTFLRISGFEEFPVLASRWAVTTTSDVYGKSFGWDILGDDKMLQTLQIQKLIALDKSNNPPMQADASVQGSINTLAGGVTRFSALLPNAGLKPAYQIDLKISEMREEILEVKKAIDDGCFTDLFRMMIEIERTGVTATEIAEKQSERINMLSPMISRLNNEQNNPLIDRLFNMQNRLGLLPEIPPEVEELIGGMPIKVTYVSVFAQAQKMIGITAMEQSVNFIGGLSKLNMEVIDNLDVDETARIYNDSIGAPAKILVDPAIVDARRKARAKKQADIEKAQAMADMAAGAKNAAGATKDLGATPVGANSALDKVLGGITGAQP